MQVILKWLKLRYRAVVDSIAFIPAVIAVLFLFLSIAMIEFDFSPTGKDIKTGLHWLSLKDAATARSICSAIAGGLISLAVFSFSMVMILLNQAASQMTNRLLGKLIGNRFQQIVLGLYIGTIVYALFLLSTIRDIDSGVYVPAMSTYLLIALTILDIFLFIYFLHYVTDTIKYDTVIANIHQKTLADLHQACQAGNPPLAEMPPHEGTEVGAHKSGLYQGFDKKELIQFCEKYDVYISLVYPSDTYLIKGTPLLVVKGSQSISREQLIRKISLLLNIDSQRKTSHCYYHGFRELVEIAIRALSPGINDPGTAVLGLHALSDLLAYRLNHFPTVTFVDTRNKTRIWAKEKSIEDLLKEYILPIWDYGKNDRLVREEMLAILTQLNRVKFQPLVSKLLGEVKNVIDNSSWSPAN